MPPPSGGFGADVQRRLETADGLVETVNADVASGDGLLAPVAKAHRGVQRRLLGGD